MHGNINEDSANSINKQFLNEITTDLKAAFNQKMVTRVINVGSNNNIQISCFLLSFFLPRLEMNWIVEN